MILEPVLRGPRGPFERRSSRDLEHSSIDVAAAGPRCRGTHAAVLGIRTSGCVGQLDAGTPTAFSLRSGAFGFWARATGCIPAGRRRSRHETGIR